MYVRLPNLLKLQVVLVYMLTCYFTVYIYCVLKINQILIDSHCILNIAEKAGGTWGVKTLCSIKTLPFPTFHWILGALRVTDLNATLCLFIREKK